MAEDACSVCFTMENPEEMLLCGKCNASYHMGCLRPSLKTAPEGDWFCSDCAPRKVALSRSQRVAKREQVKVEEDFEESKPVESKPKESKPKESKSKESKPKETKPAAKKRSKRVEPESESESESSESELESSDSSSSESSDSDASEDEPPAKRRKPAPKKQAVKKVAPKAAPKRSSKKAAVAPLEPIPELENSPQLTNAVIHRAPSTPTSYTSIASATSPGGDGLLKLNAFRYVSALARTKSASSTLSDGSVISDRSLSLIEIPSTTPTQPSEIVVVPETVVTPIESPIEEIPEIGLRSQDTSSTPPQSISPTVQLVVAVEEVPVTKPRVDVHSFFAAFQCKVKR